MNISSKGIRICSGAGSFAGLLAGWIPTSLIVDGAGRLGLVLIGLVIGFLFGIFHAGVGRKWLGKFVAASAIFPLLLPFWAESSARSFKETFGKPRIKDERPWLGRIEISTKIHLAPAAVGRKLEGYLVRGSFSDAGPPTYIIENQKCWIRISSMDEQKRDGQECPTIVVESSIHDFGAKELTTRRLDNSCSRSSYFVSERLDGIDRWRSFYLTRSADGVIISFSVTEGGIFVSAGELCVLDLEALKVR